MNKKPGSSICLNCGEAIRNKRSDAKFCTPKCKQQHYVLKHEDIRMMNLARNHVQNLLVTDYNHYKRVRDSIDKDLENNSHPHKEALFNKLVKEYHMLMLAEKRIEQLYALKEEGTITMSDVDKNLKEVLEENRQFELQHSNRLSFLSLFYRTVLFHLRKLQSKMKLEKLDELEYDFSENFEDDLIGFHATITEKLYIKGD